MAVKSTRVTVGTTPTALNVTTEGDAYTGQSIAVQSTADFFVGGPDVTAANGFRVIANSALSVELQRYNSIEEKLYAVVATGTLEVSVLQQGV